MSVRKRSLNPQNKKPKVTRAAEQNAANRTFEQECRFIAMRENKIRYAGQWVALDGDHVVAVGNHPKDVVAEAARRGFDDPMVHYFSARDPDTFFWGGWQ